MYKYEITVYVEDINKSLIGIEMLHKILVKNITRDNEPTLVNVTLKDLVVFKNIACPIFVNEFVTKYRETIKSDPDMTNNAKLVITYHKKHEISSICSVIQMRTLMKKGLLLVGIKSTLSKHDEPADSVLLKCVVCMEMKTKLMYPKCGHFCVCYSCGDYIGNKCPVCRSESVPIRVFLS